ncbi:MAG TPA: sigma-70 family RNA polymerase sigma factor [Candidatus Uhrbacteria bacterium]|nr:sigma-70 family RNA polymerase sigma factor [Candidatus Uhrbacteria bacterium]
MELTDKEIKDLILKAQKGDQEAFAQIYDLFFERIYKYNFFRTKDAEEAEDLTSLVFLKAWQNLARYKIKPQAKFSTWLFQVARYTLIDHYRKQRKELPLEEVKEQKIISASAIEIKAEVEEVRNYIRLLPESYQTVINLRYFENLDYKEISLIMGKTQVSVRVLLHRAIKKLSNLMQIENE